MYYQLTLDITAEQAAALQGVVDGQPNVVNPVEENVFRVSLANLTETQRLTMLKWLLASGNETVAWTSVESLAAVQALIKAVLANNAGGGGHHCHHHSWIDDFFGTVKAKR
jgi:hypothetical protein